MSLNPFAVPAALLDLSSTGPVRRIGRFWGWVFAVPFAACLALCLVATAGNWVKRDLRGTASGLGLDALCCVLIFMSLACGRWWARRFSQGRWPLVFGFALLIGALGQVVFWTGLFAVFTAAGGHSVIGSHPSFTSDDAAGFLVGWLGTSLYALLQGLLVRGSLKRSARRQESLALADPHLS